MPRVFHTPVLLKETIDYLKVREGEKYIDATLGGGGHAAEILERGGLVLGIDRDPDALNYVRNISQSAINNEQLAIRHANFADIDKVAKEGGFKKSAGVLFDLGMSSYQLEKSGRGFSFQKDEELDMRMNPDLKVTAKDLVNGLTKNELIKLFKTYGEEQYSKRFAAAVVRARKVAPINSAERLAETIAEAAPKRGKIHPATRVFQALRIAVNDELNNLNASLPRALDLLRKGGRLVVISFHSLEDKIADQFMAKNARAGKAAYLTGEAVRPTAAEVKQNPRASSAKLRAMEKI